MRCITSDNPDSPVNRLQCRSGQRRVPRLQTLEAARVSEARLSGPDVREGIGRNGVNK